jgi:signal transduction histidine kinase/CheY-like chemotaxis protein
MGCHRATRMTLAVFALSIFVFCLVVLLLVQQMRLRVLRMKLRAAADVKQKDDLLLSRHTELNSLKDEFVSNVSHELRTPLTSIRGALGLLSAGLIGPMDAKAQNLLRIALGNTDRLMRLINDILDLERMQSGRATLQVRRCSLAELTQQSIDTMSAIADAAGISLTLSVAASSHSVFFDGDPDRIQQVLTNLISNAIKFSPAGASIRLRLEADAQSIYLRVSDSGRGIPVEKLDSIFDRFEQVEASDARQKGGTGLGLAISRTIIQQHNGSIWAESNVQHGRGAGASFIVALPRMGRLTDPASAITVTPVRGQGTVLLCDDDAGIRTVVGEHLLQHGYRILEAETGQQAIELATSHPVEAILLDLAMPGLSGWETLQKLKLNPATASIPVVVLSVFSPGEKTGGTADVAASAQGWVQKPFNEDLLLAELSRVLHAGNGPANILLVEDDKDLASLVIAGFGEASVHIDHASTRQNAIERCLLSRPDLMILDLTLPDGDGFSLVDWLRQQPDLRMLPLVVYSGHDVSDSEMSQLRLGPTQFLNKAKVQPREVEKLVLNIVQNLRAAPALSLN